MQNARDPRHHLPLKPSAFAVLAALAEAPRTGVDVLEAVNATVPGLPLFGPGTLYRLLRELRQERLIARVEAADPGGDERHAMHELTTLGRAVLRAETARLRRTLDLAERRTGGSDR